MKQLSILLIVLSLLASPGAAQTKGDHKVHESIKSVALKWQDAWNRHDVATLGSLVAEDVDFITVGGNWQKSRNEFEQHHARLHEIQMKESVLTVKNTKVKFLTSNVAVAHIEWAITGDKDVDGTVRQPRQGILTWVLKKAKGKWSIIASQNTNLKLPISAK